MKHRHVCCWSSPRIRSSTCSSASLEQRRVSCRRRGYRATPHRRTGRWKRDDNVARGEGNALSPSAVYELVASIAAIGDRGQREVTCRAVPFRLPSRQRHRVVKGRENSGALCPFARMVTGEATTAVVTPAWRVGSRLEACLWCAPRPRGLRTSCGGRTKRWHLQPV